MKMDAKQTAHDVKPDDSSPLGNGQIQDDPILSKATGEDEDEDNERSKLMKSDNTNQQDEHKTTSVELTPGFKQSEVNSILADRARLTSTPESSLTYSPEDYRTKLLSLVGGDTIYGDCTVPYDIRASRERFFKSGSRSRTPNSALGEHDNLDSDGRLQETRINMKTEDETAENSGTKGKAGSTANKTTVSSDMIQSINNLRQNVNNQIIGGSKNVMCRMRKLSINELKNGSSASRKYRLAFYGALLLLCVLFLYLIYQNLFNER